MLYKFKRWIKQKKHQMLKKEINYARRFLEEQGLCLTRDWMDIEYKGVLYYTFMIEEYADKIVITYKRR